LIVKFLSTAISCDYTLQTMQRKTEFSLLTQTGLIIGLITLLAVIGIGSSFSVTQTIQGAGTSINASGTLRMLSHKLATQMMRDQQSEDPDPENIRQLIHLFESQLNHPSLQTFIPKLEQRQRSNNQISVLYSAIQRRWRHEMQPLLISYATLLETPPEQRLPGKPHQTIYSPFQQIYLSKIDAFVSEINHMVKAIEDQTEAQIQLLHDIGYISLLLLLLTILAAPFLFYRKILIPLKDLLQISGQVRQRDFSTQAKYIRQDELGQLAQAFNLMISDLSATYTELENRITDKTQALIEESNRITLMEERNTIAQELHDSLAQSLFYIKIQISRINTLTKQNASYAQLAPIIDELNETNNTTDHQLRELISTFRININPEGLSAAIHEILQREALRSSVELSFDNQIPDFSFSHNEEVHLIQIIQEAISNINKHANASTGSIQLNYILDKNLVSLTIKDNGIGISATPHRPNHFGLNNMEERAQAIHGTLSIAPHPEQGTQVTLFFPPALSQESRL
jgi:nitrate/nitrite-specific signal transduction histidine kinase